MQYVNKWMEYWRKSGKRYGCRKNIKYRFFKITFTQSVFLYCVCWVWFVWVFFPNQFHALFNPAEFNFSVNQHLLSGASQFPLPIISFFFPVLPWVLLFNTAFRLFFSPSFCPVFCSFYTMFLSCSLHLLSPQTVTKIVTEEILVNKIRFVELRIVPCQTLSSSLVSFISTNSAQVWDLAWQSYSLYP